MGVAVVAGALVLGACSGGVDSGEATTTASATPTTSIPVATTTIAAAAIESASVAIALGDPERGYEVWEDGGGVLDSACSDCHSVDGTEGADTAPSFKDISERAGGTVDGLSAEEYLRESILDPRAYVVVGFEGGGGMPNSYPYLLSDEDIDDLVAFLLDQ
jgi:mono/diheme cytochrome c family protein